MDELCAAQYPLGANGDCVDPESKLVHILEIQRRKEADDGNHYVGGLATLTTVTRDGVQQRVVHRWPEDKVGERIEPRPIDWAAWRAARVRPEGSWLKRQMAARRARKRVGWCGLQRRCCAAFTTEQVRAQNIMVATRCQVSNAVAAMLLLCRTFAVENLSHEALRLRP
jgi:hypothetical protein